MKELFRFLRPYRRDCVIGPLFKLLEAGFDLLVPLVVASIIDGGIRNGSDADVSHILLCAGALVLLAVVGLLAAVAAQYFAARAAVGAACGIRQALFDKTLSLSSGQLDRIGKPTLLTRMTSDVGQVQTGVNLGLRLLLRSPLIVFGAMIMAFTIDARAALIFVGVIVLLSVAVFGILLSGIPLHKKVQTKLDGVTAATRETLTGVRVLRAFCREEEENARFAEKNGALTAAATFAGRVSALLNPVTYVLINGAVIFLLWVSGARVELGTLTCGQVVALYNYLSQILVELVKLANLIITITRASACMKRIGDVLREDGEMPVPGDPAEGKPDAPFVLEFDDVSFRYPGAGDDALSHISLRVKPGENVGIIGGTGAGKSSLARLALRFYDATEGSVSAFGVPVTAADPAAIRRRTAIVEQHTSLFSGTVRDNLRYGDENATDDELWAALEAAQAADFVREKGGLDAPVAQEGRNFSGGQRQRLSVARALCRRPELLILDDASSALDYATDAAMRRAVAALPWHPAVLTVSQRTSSVAGADRILVLDDGCAVGLGTHEELLSSCDVYREIYASQYGESEAQA